MVESNKHKKIAVFFAAVLRPRHGNTEQFHRSDSHVRFFEMMVGDLAAVETIRLHDRLKLLEILSTVVRRPFVRLVLVTGGLTNIDFLLLSVKHSTACDLPIEFLHSRGRTQADRQIVREIQSRSEKARTLQCPAVKGATVLDIGRYS